MSKFSPSGISGIANSPTPISISGAVTPFIINVAMLLAGTEYTAALPASAVRFTIRLQDPANIQLAYAAGTSGTTFLKINRNCIYGESELSLTPAGLNLYFQADKPSQIAEIVYWTT